MILPNFIENLKDANTKILTASQLEININLEVKPQDFLLQAEKDLEAKVYTNCLSNSKRALDGQINSILIALGFKNKLRKDVPTKLKFLNNFGIVAPRILNKINTVRNIFEHEFKMPENDLVEDFLSVTSLFIANTNHFITKFTRNFTIVNDDIGIHVNIYRDYKNSQIKLDDQRHYDNGNHLNIAKYYAGSSDNENKFSAEDKNKNVKTVIIDITNNEYKDLIKFMINWKQK
jgi:hypothetical protein